MITPVVLADTSVLSHNYHFFFVVRTFEIYFLSNLQVYNTVFLAIITMLYIPSPELVILITGNLCLLTNIFPSPPPPLFL